MKKSKFSYVRSHRTGWALSAEEFARLLGRNASMVSRIEKSGQTPSGKVALGCEVIFGIAARDMFPRLYEQVEETIMGRAARLFEQLDGKTDRKSVRKRALLADMMARATNNTIRL